MHIQTAKALARLPIWADPFLRAFAGCLFKKIHVSVHVYAVIISKYATKIVGTQNLQVAWVHGTQDQKQSTFNTFKPA